MTTADHRLEAEEPVFVPTAASRTLWRNDPEGLDRYVAEMIAGWRPLTQEERARIEALLTPVNRPVGTP